ncbi:hypothetical protein GPX89_36920 [Nocardia sp. ET3-3]|uniref:Uncharacterized protein n=1 Tax=Nocardia terrae TaxID=2675851 RepID=A0A7K1V829_9NOCA|nr:hypothetical protein [Nocardia terrae]MVU82805.1 hypothetical protein [Nocardia terrae]
MTLEHRTALDHTGLRAGMTMLLPPGAPTTDRIRLSSGIRLASETSYAEDYADRAFVPRGPWRAPTCHERALLFGRPVPAALPGEWLAVLPAPARVLEACAVFRGLPLATGESGVRELAHGPAGRTALVEILRWAATLTDPARPGIEAPLLYGKSPAGQPTMTTGGHGRRVGLHVDSWYTDPLSDRSTAPNRLSVNLGSHDRHLLFVNAPLQGMAQALAQVDLLSGAADPKYALGQRFMEVFPHYPVTRLTIHPGEAYLAPTENMLHDGHAEPHGDIDTQFSCRGYFAAPRQ